MNGEISFGLLSAVFSGVGDVCGGVAVRRAHPFCVVLGAQGAGALLLLLAAVALRQPLPQVADLAWAAGSGLAGAIGLLALYTALGRGQMGIVAPLSAVIAATVPIAAAAVLEGLPTGAQLAGFVVALLAVWLLAGTGGGEGQRPQGQLRLALLAGLAFGCYFVLIDQANPTSGLWNLSFARSVPALLLLAILRARRQPLLAPRPVLPLNLLNGALDAGGSLCFVLAAHLGRLDTASVLASLYPAATLALACLLLRERMGRPQAVGAGAAFVAIILIVL
jgi:drug/metabolite transporter (DMT)-like permease